MSDKEIEKILREILNFRREVREKGNSDYDRISNKDILLHLLVKLDSLESRISKAEAKTKILMWVIPALIALVGTLKIF